MRRTYLVLGFAVFIIVIASGIVSIWDSASALPVFLGSCFFFTIPLLMISIREFDRTRAFWIAIAVGIVLGAIGAYFALPFIPASVYANAHYIFLVPLGIYGVIIGAFFLNETTASRLSSSRNFLDAQLERLDNYDGFADSIDRESLGLLQFPDRRPLSRRRTADISLRSPDEGRASNLFEEILWRFARSIAAPLDPIKALPAEIAGTKPETIWDKLALKRPYVLILAIILIALLPLFLLSFFYNPGLEWLLMSSLFPSLLVFILRLPVRASQMSSAVYRLDLPFYIGTAIPFALILNLPEPLRMGLSLPYLLIVIYFWLLMLGNSLERDGIWFLGIPPILAYLLLLMLYWSSVASLGILGMLLIPLAQIPLWIVLLVYLRRAEADSLNRRPPQDDRRIDFDDI